MMWICPKCSEQHEDQFEFCWKCIGDEMKTAFSATPLPAAPVERPLRPFRDFVVRGLAGFAIGFIVTMTLLSAGSTKLGDYMYDNSILAATMVSLTGGAILGGAVGIFFWVLFPYAPAHGQVVVDADANVRQN